MSRAELLASWERALDSADTAIHSALGLQVFSRSEATQLERRLRRERDWLANAVREFPDLGSAASPMRPLSGTATIKAMKRKRSQSGRRHVRVRRNRAIRRPARRAAKAARRFSVNPDASGV